MNESVPAPLTVPLPSDSDAMALLLVTAREPPETVTTGAFVSTPPNERIPLVIVRTEAPALPVSVEDPPTVIAPIPRFSITTPPLSW